jgi:uncharacterized protein
LKKARVAAMASGTNTSTPTPATSNGSLMTRSTMMGTAQNIEVIREIFGAIERRDQERFAQLCTPDLKLHWPPSLPYGGVSRGLDSPKPNWQDTWGPLQPTDAERRMDSRVVAATDEEAVVLWHQRGLSPTGERIDQPVLGLYRFRDGRLARGQMFYFDTADVARFLEQSNSETSGAGIT